jgi:hypothetical protein
LRNVSNRLANPCNLDPKFQAARKLPEGGGGREALVARGPPAPPSLGEGSPRRPLAFKIQLVERTGVGDVPVADGDERTGCLSTLGLAVGTFVVSMLLAVIATVLIGSVPASRIGALLGVVLIPHMVGIGFTRGRIRRGAQLFRIAAAIVAVEVGLVVLLLLLAALTA